MLKYTAITGATSGPAMIEPASGRPSLVETVVTKLPDFKQQLLDHGALLFRGFNISDTKDFDEFVGGMSAHHMPYEYRSTPRSEVTERVLTATSYPAKLEIPQHNENSYHRRWPMLLAFCCAEPASDGGETPIACMKAVTASVGDELMEQLEQRGVEYVRHYHQGVDLPWQDVFQTQSRAKVEEFCSENDITSSWLEGELLRTSNVAQGVASHPATGEKTFFNQAHLFHVSSLGEAQATALRSMFGSDRLPRHARFGDGSEIPDSARVRISDAFKENLVVFSWSAGDVLLVDNMQYSHGRRPFKGTRRVFAALMDPYPN
jgi:alpha-ketoglutarate-dependent taurine dioxygenase